MAKLQFSKATKKQSRARIALQGPGGSGKTWTALELASGLGARVAVIDSERGSASKYSDRFSFDVLELESFGPERYIEAIQAAEAAGYDVVIVDSLSHAWNGKDGILERVDRKGGMAGWKDVTPQHNRLVDALLQCKAHVIVTLRVKTEYAYETNDRGKVAPRKVGLAPVQKDGLEYEFDVVAALDTNNNLSVEKTRCAELNGRTWRHQNPEIAAVLKTWLTDGAPMIATAPAMSVHSGTDPERPAPTTTSPVDSAPDASSAPAGATSTSTPPGVGVAKKVFPAAVAVDPVREEALIEVRRLIGSVLQWEVSQSRAFVAERFGGRKLTKELTTEEVLGLKALLIAEAAK